MNDVLINKIKSIQRCIKRAREEYETAEDNFKEDFTHQDAAILNITRACEQTIDVANLIIKKEKIGIPSDSGESFDLLFEAGIISEALRERLKKMVGFRNTMIHQYQDADIDIVISVIKEDLNDIMQFTELITGRERKQG
jgi:uncharacterized protein YutE (UPF0331/DUF86 family)